MRWVVLVLLLLSASSRPGPAQTVGPPEVLGTLVGPGSGQTPGLGVYGTDLGWTFEHQGRLLILFGDTWPNARFLCDTVPINDDTQATLPLAPPAGVPPITFATIEGRPDALQNIRVRRGTESLSMGFGKTPVTAFSDGTDAFGVFLRGDYVRCMRRAARARPSCQPHEHLACAGDVGECTPVALGLPALCELATGAGCLPGQTCQAVSEGGFCIDPRSPQSDGTAASHRFMAADRLQIARQDAAVATDYDSVAELPSNKFTNVTARTVGCFSGRTCGNDYRVGDGALLMWGRPGFVAENGREAQLFLLTHPLPIRRDRAGRLRFRPRYFAGLNKRGEPRWSRRESRAQALALDGVVRGSPHEEQPIAAQTSISWIGEPVNRWMMLYSGDLANYLLQNPATARPGASPGAVRVRFAENPWGPWSPPEPHLIPGSPTVPGDAYAPGGLLFHSLCQDEGAALCARSDPTRPPDAFLPGCPGVGATFDIGHFYAPNIIDAYTRPDGAGGLDVYWNVSTWNPYAVAFLRTNVQAADGSSGFCAIKRPITGVAGFASCGVGVR